GRRLFARSVRGVSLTENGQRLLPVFVDLLSRFELVDGPPSAAPEVTVAGEAYLLAAFLPVRATCTRGSHLRESDRPASPARAPTADGWFDLALLTGGAPLPETWQERKVGTLRRGLFATPKLATKLGPSPVSIDEIRRHPFVLPLYRAEAFLPVDDGCP